jgi:ferrochelatase
VTEAFGRLPLERRESAELLFTAHSLPESMAQHSPYVAQLMDSCASAAALASARLAKSAAATASAEQAESAGRSRDWQLVYQSNNARYGGESWLGPDIGDALEAEAAAGRRDVVVMPIGFVCDHMEVVLDLDVDAAKRAEAAGIRMTRAGTVGAHPAYVAMVRELLLERMAGTAERRVTGRLPPKHDLCPADCCLPGRPGPAKLSLCGADDRPAGGLNA